MNREELATQLEEVGEAVSQIYRRVPESIQVAVVELRKTCATCKNFDAPCIAPEIKLCDLRGSIRVVPSDGSGFCHSWERV